MIGGDVADVAFFKHLHVRECEWKLNTAKLWGVTDLSYHALKWIHKVSSDCDLYVSSL